MKININTQSFTASPAIQDQVHDRLTLALSRFADQVSHIDVHMQDINGHAKGGEDKRVLINVHLFGIDPIVVQTISDDLYKAIAIASRRAKRGVNRAIRKQSKIERGLKRKWHSMMDDPSSAGFV